MHPEPIRMVVTYEDCLKHEQEITFPTRNAMRIWAMDNPTNKITLIVAEYDPPWKLQS